MNKLLFPERPPNDKQWFTGKRPIYERLVVNAHKFPLFARYHSTFGNITKKPKHSPNSKGWEIVHVPAFGDEFCRVEETFRLKPYTVPWISKYMMATRSRFRTRDKRVVTSLGLKSHAGAFVIAVLKHVMVRKESMDWDRELVITPKKLRQKAYTHDPGRILEKPRSF